MEIIAYVFTALTCLLHGYFLVLEMFLWTTPYGMSVFRMNEQKAESTKVLAANQGLYNGLLALGLLLSFFLSDPVSAMAIRCYCLAFIVFVGCYGWYSLKSFKVFVIQALPALIALVATYAHFKLV
jgi:putative membrane protein